MEKNDKQKTHKHFSGDPCGTIVPGTNPTCPRDKREKMGIYCGINPKKASLSQGRVPICPGEGSRLSHGSYLSRTPSRPKCLCLWVFLARLRGVWPPFLEIGRNGSFSPFLRLCRGFPDGAKSTWEIQKTEENGLFPRISSDLLEPPSLPSSSFPWCFGNKKKTRKTTQNTKDFLPLSSADKP